MPAVSPHILRWARETAGMTLAEAAPKVQIVEKNLAAFEAGESVPSRAMLARMAKQYRRPLLVFYLDKPPRTSDYGTDFRGRSHTRTRREDALLSALLRNIKARQQMVRAILEEEESPLPFVGWLTRITSLPTDTNLLEREIQNIHGADFTFLIDKALEGLGSVLGNDTTNAAYWGQPDTRTAFNFLRNGAEAAGVFVLLQDNLGSHKSRLPSTLFRAFVISDDLAPFVVINSGDIFPAKSFSLLHELVHLLLGQTGVSDSEVARPIETFCDQVAAEWLLPSNALRILNVDHGTGYTELIDVIMACARKHNLGHTMIATRLLQQEMITDDIYVALREHYTRMWQKEQKRKIEEQQSRDGKPIMSYALRRQRLGANTIQFAKNMVASGELTVTKAATILGVKPNQVFKLLYGSSDSQAFARTVLN